MSQIEIKDKDKIMLDKTGGYTFHQLDDEKSLISSIDIAIVYSNYNLSVNESIMNGYLNRLSQKKFLGNIGGIKSPGGAFEVPIVCQRIIKSYYPSILLAIGCIVKGDTKHYDFLSSTVTTAISNLSLSYDVPIINGILTVEDNNQAIDRAGAKHNKGPRVCGYYIRPFKILSNLSDQ